MLYNSLRNFLFTSLLCTICVLPTSFLLGQEKKSLEEELKIAITDNSKKMNFRQILEFTFNNNDVLNAEREKTKAIQTLKFKTLGKNALPNVGIDLNYGYTDFKEKMGNDTIKFNIDADGEMMDNSIYLSQPIFKSGRTATQMKSVKNQILMQQSKLFQTEQEVLYNTVYAIINLLQNEEILKLAIQNEESLKNNYKYIKARKEVGRATIADLSLAEARYSSSKSDTINAKTNYLTAKSNFYKITKINSNDIDVKYDDIFQIGLNYSADYNNVLEASLSKNPQYQMAKYNYEMNKNNLQFTKTNFLPELFLNAQYGKQKTSDVIVQTAGSVSLNLKVPLFQSGVEYASHKEAGHLLNEAKFTLNDIKETLTNQTATTYDEFLSSKSLIVSSKAYRDAAKIAYENTVAEEKVGRSTVVDVLNRRREYFDTEVSFLKNKTNTIMYYYTLKMLMGELNLNDLFI